MHVIISNIILQATGNQLQKQNNVLHPKDTKLKCFDNLNHNHISLMDFFTVTKLICLNIFIRHNKTNFKQNKKYILLAGLTVNILLYK